MIRNMKNDVKFRKEIKIKNPPFSLYRIDQGN